MVALKQPSFAGGILSPQALGRTDLQKYAVGLRTCANAWITRYGTVENRPGTIYCGAVKDSTNAVRLVPFVLSQNVSYLLEFGAQYIRVYKQGARISVAGAAAYNAGTTYGAGDIVTYSGAVYYSYNAGNVGHQPDMSPTYWYPQTGNLLEIPTGITQGAISVFQYVQRNDLMTIVSQQFAPVQLQRYSDTKWAFVTFVPSTGIDAPTGVTASAGTPTSVLGTPTGGAAVGGDVGQPPIDYYLLAWRNSPGGFSAPTAAIHVTHGPTSINPITLTWNAVAGADGYAVYRGGSQGLIAVTSAATWVDNNDPTQDAHGLMSLPIGPGDAVVFTYQVTAVNANGIESLASASATCTGNTPTDSNPNSVHWTAVTGAVSYNIYKSRNGIFGFIGKTTLTTFTDNNIIADTSTRPPVAPSLFATSNDYPAVVGYYQQRLCFANTINQPQTVWMSRVGSDYTFTVSTPVADSDSVSFTIAGKQVQDIRALVDLGKLVIHTGSSEYVAQGNQFGTITPTATSLVATGSAGADLIQPVVIGNTDLFVQRGATRLNDLRYEVQRFAYAGKDLTKLASDLFRGRTIIDMQWAKLPHSTIWCVLDNGIVVGLTYVSEDELWAWHSHAFANGAVENVAVVPENSAYTVYLCVRRVVGGATARYIERLAPRDCIDTVLFTDSVFCDASLTYDGRNTGATTMTVTAPGGAWTTGAPLTITASVSTFASGDVGNQIVLQQKDSLTGLVTDQVTLAITAYTSVTVVTAQPARDVPTWAQGVATTSWGKAVKSFSGIGHLNGQAIAALADGNVVANPLTSAYPTITVASGAFTIPEPALVVTAGLPIQMDLQTLPLENVTGETIAHKRVMVQAVTPIFYNSRGGLFGQDSAHLDVWKQPRTQAEGYPTPPFTGPSRIPIRGTPQTTGQVWIRNVDPVPFSISGLVISAEIGGS